MDPKTKSSQSKLMTSTALTLFGQPPLLGGEDPAAYDLLFARVCAAVKPVDAVDEIFVADVVCLEWEVLRWRRLKWTLMQATGLKALEGFLLKQLEANYALHEEHFKSWLAETFRNNLPKDQADSAERLADECAQHTDDGDKKLDEVLGSIGLDTGTVLDEARGHKVKELVDEYVRREPNAVTLVEELLSSAGTSIEALTINLLYAKFEYIERIDRLTTIAESRRNASLREIDRRHALLGEKLRQSVQEIEDAEFETIETTPAKRKMQLDEQSQDQGQPRECAS
jgi:hypothetical protein